MRRVRIIASAVLIALLPVIPSATPQPVLAFNSCSTAESCSNTMIDNWPVPIPDGMPAHLINGPDGEVWTTNPGNDFIERFDVRDGALLSTYHIKNNNNSNNTSLALGPDGNVWVTVDAPVQPSSPTGSAGNEIMKITPGGAETPYCLDPNSTVLQSREGPYCSSPSGDLFVAPTGIVKGPPSDANAMWFGDGRNGYMLGRISTAGTPPTNYLAPAGTGPGEFALSVALGPDSTGTPNAAVWVGTFGNTALMGSNHIIRFNVSSSGPVADLTLALPSGFHPFGLGGGPTDGTTHKQDGIWITDNGNNSIGFVSYSGAITIWPINVLDPNNNNDSSGDSPQGIALGPDGNIYVAAINQNLVAVISPSAAKATPNGTAVPVQTVYRIPGGQERPYDVAVGPDNNVWFTSVDHAKIGRIKLNTPASLTPGATPFTYSSQFLYNYYSPSTYQMHQQGFPYGIATTGSTALELTMAGSDRLQRIPTTSFQSPPTYGNVVDEASPLVDPTTAMNPWRTIRPQDTWQPRDLATRVGSTQDEWISGMNDTVEKVTPGNGTIGDNWTTEATTTGPFVCCLTASGAVFLSGPGGMTSRPDGTVWFSEFTSSKIARADTGTVTEEALPTVDSAPFGITSGTDNSLWFTEYKADQIGVRSPQGPYTEYQLPSGSQPFGITHTSDGVIWFTLRGSNQVGAINPAQGPTIHYFPLLTSASQPTSIAVGPDGRSLFVTEYLTGKVARLSVADYTGWSGTWTEWNLPYGALSRPWGITTGPDNNVWVTMPYPDNVAEFTPN